MTIYTDNTHLSHCLLPLSLVLSFSPISLDGIFIASPEYNGFTTPLLLNAITWATRGEGDMYEGFKNKVCVVMATSPGAMGGLRMIRSLNTFLQDMGAIVLPGHHSIGNANKVFTTTASKDDEGSESGSGPAIIIDERTKAKIDGACQNLMNYCRYQTNQQQDCEIAQQLMMKYQQLKCMGEYGQVDS